MGTGLGPKSWLTIRRTKLRQLRTMRRVHALPGPDNVIPRSDRDELIAGLDLEGEVAGIRGTRLERDRITGFRTIDRGLEVAARWNGNHRRASHPSRDEHTHG